MTSPRGFGLPHLSEDAVAAFADGVLSAAAASRARRHCDECPECAGAVRVQREAAMMLRTARAPSLPSGLLDRLAGLPMSTPLPPRRGVPTVLGADGVPMFLAHDARGAGSTDETKPGGEPDVPGQPQHGVRPTPRRGAVPVTVLASAAAVVAAGTFGGHASTLAAESSLRAPAGAANAAGGFGGSQPTSARSSSPLVGTGLLAVGGLSTGPSLDSQLVTSVTVTPVLRTAHRSTSSTTSPVPSATGFWGVTRSAAATPAGAGVAAPVDPKGTGPGKTSTGPAPAAGAHRRSTATP